MSFHASPSDRTVRCCTFSKILPSSCFASGFLHRPHCRIALEQLTAQVDAGLVLKTSGVPHFLSDSSSAGGGESADAGSAAIRRNVGVPLRRSQLPNFYWLLATHGLSKAITV